MKKWNEIKRKIEDFLTEWLGIRNLTWNSLRHSSDIERLENKAEYLEKNLCLIQHKYDVLNSQLMEMELLNRRINKLEKQLTRRD